MKKNILFSILVAALTFSSGCFDPFYHNPYFKVDESGLNWLEIYHKQISGKKLVRVRIDGNGVIKVKEGTSPLVGDGFAHDNSHENWEDIRDYRLTVSREETNRIFQELVNNGLFLEQKKSDDSPEGTAIMAFGNIQNHTVYATVYDSDLYEHLNALVLTFYHPQPKRR
ncbi:MAG: hypothetical protein PHO37_02125 [Kiritimatiellae bacterium]|nr:hypothetical protein [Kiritimatiellia bacterium]